ncbi:MAG: RagB/SusD family nutrient uptake outer membrane protein [Flavobacterium psychrophilum]|nr:MAG: RagB/SusD family nutrient uptake outer membrane protein [Flavobacterium psychrophilum]
MIKFLNMNFRIKQIIHLLIISICLLCCPQCKKFVDVASPATSVTNQNAYASSATAIAVLNSIYSKISSEAPNTIAFSHISSWVAGAYADDFMMWNTVTNVRQLAYYRNNLSAIQSTGYEVWRSAYSYIYTCNAAIEGLTKTKSLPIAVRDQLLGEAKLMRGLFYFYLINLYGDVPLVLSTSYDLSQTLSRASVEVIYGQIVKDVTEAELILHEDYLDGTLGGVTTERVRPTKAVARALLARVYLYNQKWDKAEEYASLVIADNKRFSLQSLNRVFLKNNPEAIWQLQPTSLNYNTQDGRLFTLPSSGPNRTNAFYLSDDLLKGFEPGDLRRQKWIDSVSVQSKIYHYPGKYKIGLQDNSVNSISSLKEYLVIFRLGEQYLIRAEARARLNNIPGAAQDLNELRKRARAQTTPDLPNPLPDLDQSISSAVFMEKLIRERRVELFSEWGHRWFDIKRLGLADSIMPEVAKRKGGEWKTYKTLFPIPQDEILKNGKLTQNTGY